MRFDEHFVRGVVPHVSYLATVFPHEVRFSIDTRTLQEGDIFVALPGQQCDGHAFVQAAFAQGAAGVIINAKNKECVASLMPKIFAQKLVMLVPDTLEAMTSLARAWRMQFTYPVIAVTGSVGKTSTKSMLSSILSAANKKHIVSQGNLNTKIGIALTMIRMRADHEAAIFEVGINKRGEMALLADFLRPSNAVITCVGHAHMAGLGTLAEIAAEKRDIFKYFTASNIGVINGDQGLLAEVGYPHPVVKFGTKTINQVQARKIATSSSGVSFIMKLYKDKLPMVLANTHLGMAYNALAAAAVAHILNIAPQAIVGGIQQYNTVDGRFEHKKLLHGHGTLIDDCYNANPESMKAALLAFQNIETQAQKIAILGDMLELGSYGPFWHRQVGRMLHHTPSVQHVILVGDLVKWTKKTAPVGIVVDIVPSWQEALVRLQEVLVDDSLVLVKGSNGMQLSNLVGKTTREVIS